MRVEIIYVRPDIENICKSHQTRIRLIEYAEYIPFETVKFFNCVIFLFTNTRKPLRMHCLIYIKKFKCV